MPSIRIAVIRNMIANLALPATSVLTGPLLARALGVEDRGALAAIAATLTLASFLAPLGMSESIAYSVARGLVPIAHVRRVSLQVSAVLGLLGAAAVAAVAPLLLRDSPEYVPLLQLSALMLPVSVFISCYRGLAQGTGQFELMAREKWTLSFGRLVVIVGLFLAGHLTVVTGALLNALIPLATVLAFLPLLRGRPQADSKFDAASPLPADSRRLLLSYSSRTAPGTVLGILSNRMDQILLAPLAGVTALGYYAVAIALSEIPFSAVAAIRDVVWATASSRDDPALIARTSRVVTLVSLPVVLLGIALIPFVLPLLFGQAFAPAVPVAQVLLVAFLAGSASLLLSTGLLGLGEPGLRSRLQTISTVATLVLLLALAPALGAMGAALALLLSRLLAVGLFGVAFSRQARLSLRDCLVPHRDDLRYLRATLMGRFARRTRS